MSQTKNIQQFSSTWATKKSPATCIFTLDCSECFTQLVSNFWCILLIVCKFNTYKCSLIAQSC